jgi:hypothetical protein
VILDGISGYARGAVPLPLMRTAGYRRGRSGANRVITREGAPNARPGGCEDFGAPAGMGFGPAELCDGCFDDRAAAPTG